MFCRKAIDKGGLDFVFFLVIIGAAPAATDPVLQLMTSTPYAVSMTAAINKTVIAVNVIKNFSAVSTQK